MTRSVKEFFFSILLISFFSYSEGNKYCKSDICNNSNQHTLCKFQSEDPARHCIDYEKTIRSDTERQAILDKLNSRRNKVASGDIRSLPSAENMMKLEWNEELEVAAQRWANQCVKHSFPDIKDTCRDLGNVYVGQNIATITGDAPGLTTLALVDVWYMELLNINASVLSSYKPSVESGFSHYDYFTQLVWAESHQVGCGGVKFKERIHDSITDQNRTIHRLVCNFAPGGNRRNQSVYSEGVACSRCFLNGYCDSVYKALCNWKNSTDEMKETKSIQVIEADLKSSDENIDPDLSHVTQSLLENPVNVKVNSVAVEPTENEEEYNPLHYFSHSHNFTTPLVTFANSPSCKDILAVDDFVELLKKKLSTDPMFKEMLQTTKLPIQIGFTDPSVAAFVNQIYSKNAPSTTTKVSESDQFNSTLLVDLVEAVIFRSGDKIHSSLEPEDRLEVSDVNPVKIQAELAEIKRNTDFTGHYFFPEDEDVMETSTEITDSYYDISNAPVSDVILEIEDLKRTKATKDFLEEIFESDSVTESLKNNFINTKRDVKYKGDHILGKRDRKKRINRFRNFNFDCKNKNVDCISNRHSENKRSLTRVYTQSDIINYNDLLKLLASDLKTLKLNERLHCTQNNSSAYFNNMFMVYLILVVIKYLK